MHSSHCAWLWVPWQPHLLLPASGHCTSTHALGEHAVARCHAQLRNRQLSLTPHCHVGIKGLLLPTDFKSFEHTTLQRATLSEAVTAAALCIRTSAAAAAATDDQPCQSDCC
jgi:hypothetical protein